MTGLRGSQASPVALPLHSYSQGKGQTSLTPRSRSTCSSPPPNPPNPQEGQAGPSWGSRRLSTDLSPPILRQDGESCAKACQVAGSQAGGAVMSGEGSGQEAGQEQLLSCPLCCGGSLPYLAAAQSPASPTAPGPPPFTSHAPCAPSSPPGEFPA